MPAKSAAVHGRELDIAATARKACRIARTPGRAVTEPARPVAPVKDRAALVPDVAPEPGVIVLTGVLGALIDFTRPIATMSEQLGRNGTACRVDAQSESKESQLGAIRWKCAISLCINSRLCGGSVMTASATPKWPSASAS